MMRTMLAAMILTATAASASASDFKATLTVRATLPGAAAKSTAVHGVEFDAADVSSRLIKRPVMHVKVGERLTAKWAIKYVGKTKLTNMIVHFYVAGEQEAGQMLAPDLQESNVAVESAVTMDFESGDGASATMPFALDKPGAYRVQIEVIDQTSDGTHKHDHAATLDIVVDRSES